MIDRTYPPPLHRASTTPALDMPNSSPMTKDYQQLWKAVISTTDETKAVRTLADILADKEGRTFILHLDRTGAALCIKILDHVSRGPQLAPFHLRRSR